MLLLQPLQRPRMLFRLHCSSVYLFLDRLSLWDAAMRELEDRLRCRSLSGAGGCEARSLTRSSVHGGYFHATRSRRSRRAQLRISSTVRNTSSTYACRRAATDTQIRPTLTILKYSFMNDALTFSQRLRTAQR